MYFIGYIIIGIITGLIAGKIMKRDDFGHLATLFTCIIGSGVLGNWILGVLENTPTGLIGNLFTFVIVTILLLRTSMLLSSFQENKPLIFQPT
mgnify:FL=1